MKHARCGEHERARLTGIRGQVVFHMTDMCGNGVQPYRNDPGAGTSPFFGYGVPIPWPYVEKDQLRLRGETGSNKEGAKLARKTTPCWHFVKNEGKCPHGPLCIL